MDASRILSVFAIVLATLVSYANPIVWLHGWNSEGSLWKDLQWQMAESAHASSVDFLTLSYYDDGFGFSTDTPIEEVAIGGMRAFDHLPLEVVPQRAV